MPAPCCAYRNVVITGIGLVTPLGKSPTDVLDGVKRGRSAAQHPAFDTSSLVCKSIAPIGVFDPEQYIADTKSLRLMNRDAQLAVAAARLAIADAELVPGQTHAAEDIALYGSTGLTGMPAQDVAALVQHSADSHGNLDLHKFGRVALKRVRPVLSFKILANMPICFVSIFGEIRGPNGIYSPWEGQGAHAIVAGIRAIQEGLVDCALVGGCDVRTHEFAAVSLQQLGALQSWADHGEGPVPGEGAAFMILESERHAAARGARAYARIVEHAIGTVSCTASLADTFTSLITRAKSQEASQIVAAGDGDICIADAEAESIERASLGAVARLHPKRYLGNLYAAAAAVQVALAAPVARRAGRGQQVLANCFGHGSQQGVLLLEGA